jgi:hypothetical protein
MTGYGYLHVRQGPAARSGDDLCCYSTNFIGLLVWATIQRMWRPAMIFN